MDQVAAGAGGHTATQTSAGSTASYPDYDATDTYSFDTNFTTNGNHYQAVSTTSNVGTNAGVPFDQQTRTVLVYNATGSANLISRTTVDGVTTTDHIKIPAI